MKKNLLTVNLQPHQKPIAQSKAFVSSGTKQEIVNQMIGEPKSGTITAQYIPPKSEEIPNKPFAPSEAPMSTTITKLPEPQVHDIIEQPYIPGSIIDISDSETFGSELTDLNIIEEKDIDSRNLTNLNKENEK